VILTDAPDRENEGDIIFPAEKMTPDIINFMIQHCSGIICMPMLQNQLARLGVKLMLPAEQNTNPRGTPFTISIEAKQGVTTGVSAHDRAQTVLTAVSETATADDIVMPGHIFPLQAREGGVLERAGHTEGAIDLMRLAGLKPAAVLCEVMNVDGTMARGKELADFAREKQIHLLSIEDIIHYRLSHENFITETVSASLPLEKYGQFDISIVREKLSDKEHLILSKPYTRTPVLVRIHSACITGDLFGSKRCDCHKQLHYSLKKLSEEGGLLIYLNQEGRGIGLFNKIKAYALQEKNVDTVEANQQLGLPIDPRDYYIAANILRNQQITHIRLLTNNPNKINDLKKYGIAHVEKELLPTFHNEHNYHYLKTKKEKLNHHILLEEIYHEASHVKSDRNCSQ
jgi:3,4-dihydroxy 2-butanone 4-phosphate synthase / GTP cyclohydrolase II